MAEFCNYCSDQYGMEADFNLDQSLNQLKENETNHYLICEGCGYTAIKKENSKYYLLLKNKWTVFEPKKISIINRILPNTNPILLLLFLYLVFIISIITYHNF